MTDNTEALPPLPEGWELVKSPITEQMHQAAAKVLTRANGLDGTPQRMLDAMLAAAPALTAAPSAQAEPRHSTTWSGDCPHWCKACATERAERAVTQTEDLWS